MNFGVGGTNSTNYTVNLLSTIGTNVEWAPQNNNSNLFPNYSVPKYKPMSQIDVLNNPYFYSSSIQWFLTLLNRTLKKLFVVVQNEPYVTYFPKAVCPEFKWNAQTNKIDLLVSAEFTNISPSTSNNRLFITMNPPLYNLLNTFSYEILNEAYGYTPYTFDDITTGMPYVLTTLYNYDLPILLTNTGAQVYQFSQEASSVPSWTPVSSIVFVSYTIPVNSTESGTPQFLGKNPTSNNSINNLSNTITDFEISQDVGTEIANCVLQYQPTAEYRLLDLNSNNALSQLHIKVYWKDKWGQMHEYYLSYGSTASLKLLFRKKNFETANYIPNNL